MNVYKPVYGPDYSQLLLSGLKAYQGVKGIQRQEAEDERMKKADEYAAIAMKDPDAMQQLYAYDPGRAAQLQQGQRYQQQTQRASKEKDLIQQAFDGDPGAIDQLIKINPEKGFKVKQEFEQRALKFGQESSQLSERMQGKSIDGKRQILKTFIKEKIDSGENPKRTMELLNKYNSEDPADIEEAETIVQKRYEEGLQNKWIKPRGVAAPTSSYGKIAVDEGYRPGTPEYQNRVRELSAKKDKGVTVNIGAGETEAQKQFGKKVGDRVDQAMQEGQDAENLIASLDQIDVMLDSGMVKTGKIEPLKSEIASVLQGFGVDASSLANVTTSEAYAAKTQDLVNKALQQNKGPQTEGDAERMRQTFASLGKTEESNRFINKSLRAMSLRKVERRDFLEGEIDNGTPLRKALKNWNDYKRNVPMIAKGATDQNGLPVFFYEYERLAREKFPEWSRKEIIEAWKKDDALARKEKEKTLKVSKRGL